MKIPDAYIAQGNELGVPGSVPQYPLQIATAKYDRMQGMGNAITNVGGALLRLNTSLTAARQQVRADELTMQLQDGLAADAKNYSEQAEAGASTGSLVRNAPKLKERLGLTAQTFIDTLKNDEDEKVILGLRHNSVKLQQGIYNESLAAFGKRDAEWTKGTLEQNQKKVVSEVSTMPWAIDSEGNADISKFTRNQEAALSEIAGNLIKHAQAGTIFKEDVEPLTRQAVLDAALKSGQFYAESSPDNARHFLELYRTGKPIYGITDREQLKPLREAAMNTYNAAANMDTVEYNKQQRAVGIKSDLVRREYERVMVQHPGTDLNLQIHSDPEMTEADRQGASTLNAALLEHQRSGPKTSDRTTYERLDALLSKATFGGDTKSLRRAIMASGDALSATDFTKLIDRAGNAEESQRRFARAKSSDYATNLYRDGSKFIQQSVPFVSVGAASPETEESKAYSILGSISEQVILKPDMSKDDVDQAFYPLLQRAYAVLPKPKQNIEAMQFWADKIPNNGKAAEAKQYFQGLVDRDRKKVADKEKERADALAKDTINTEPKKSFKDTMKDLTDGLGKAFGVK